MNFTWKTRTFLEFANLSHKLCLDLQMSRNPSWATSFSVDWVARQAEWPFPRTLRPPAEHLPAVFELSAQMGHS